MTLMKNTLSSMILDDSTIVAIATPIGVGAISIVRLSGEKAYHIALALTHKESLKPRYAHLCHIYDAQQMPIDEALVLYFPKPYSYTTQDVCEVQCHGGIVSARAIVQLCLKLGARMAQAGEFAKRAFLGGRLDLAQVQAVAGLIQSQSLEANKILMRQLKGDLGTFVNRTRENLLEILAFSEVHIDYSEEVEESYIRDIQQKLAYVENELSHIYHVSLTRQSIIEGYTLSIIGKPNVGKSSLLNALLRYERAIVSEIEGTTRDTIEEMLTIKGSLLRIVDTAGIRESDDKIEQIGILKTKEALMRSNIIVAIFDGSRPFDAEDKAIMEILKTQCQDKYILVIINKSDLPLQCEEELLHNLLRLHNKALLCIPLHLSTKYEGVQKVLECLEEVVSTHNGDESMILTSSYQLDCIKKALECIVKAHNVLDIGQLELFSYQIQDCIESICKITHPYENAELLDRLFATFCLGK